MGLYYPELPAETPQAVKDAVRRAYDLIYKTSASLDRVNKILASASLPTAQSLEQNLTAIQKSLNTLPAFQLFTAGVSTGANPQGSIAPTVIGKFAYTSTTTSITWWWDGTNGSTVLTIFWPDGTSTPIPAGHFAITGLTINTSYNFYPYFDQNLGTVQFATGNPGASGTPAAAYAASSIESLVQQSADRHVIVAGSGAMVGITPASGSGGGSGGGGGGGCVAEGTEILPLVGAPRIRLEPWKDWVEIESRNGLVLRAVPRHRIYTERGIIPIESVQVTELAVTKRGESEIIRVDRIEEEGRKVVVEIPEGHLYWAGRFLSHNNKPAP